MVFEIWDAKESYDAFGKFLMPVLQEVGIVPSEPPWVRWTLPRFDLRGTGWSRQGAVWTTRGAL